MKKESKVKFTRCDDFMGRIAKDVELINNAIGHRIMRCYECNEPLLLKAEVDAGYCDNCCQTFGNAD